MNDQQIQKLERRVRLVEAAKQLVWLDRETAAAYVGISTTYLDILIKQRSISTSRLGQRIIIKRQDLDEYMRLCNSRLSNPVESKRAAPSLQSAPCVDASHNV